MKIHSLKIENFLVLTEAEIGLSDRGLLLVQGVNSADSSANSNGAGKSSIADALCWALYGVTARGETGDQVVNNKAGKNTRVEVVILDDMTTYRIVRHRKHKTGKNALHVFMDEGVGEKDLTKGTDKLTQEVVDRIIGASLEVFSGSIYAGQERMPDLPSMTDKMLKVLIEEAAGITALEAAYRKARENAQAAKLDLAEVEGRLANHQMVLSNREQQLQQSVQSEKDWDVNRQAQIKAMTDKVRDELIPAAKALAAEAPQSEIDRLTAEIGAIDAKIAAVGQENVQLQQLQQASVAATMEVTRLKSEYSGIVASVDRAKNQLSQAQHKVGCPCNECGRPLTPAELGAVISGAQASVTNHLAAEEAKLDELAQAESAQTAAQDALTTFRQGMTDVTREVAQRAALEAQRVTLQAKDQRRVAVLADAKNHMAAIGRLQAETSPFVAQIAGQQQQIDDIRKEIANLTGAVAVKRERFALETEVVRVFSPAGVRARILDEVTPYLNAQTGKYLSILSDGNISAEWSTLTVSKAGEVKEKFAIDVSSTISSKTFKGLSGGEKRKVRVASALALQDLVATRASKPIDLFIADEVDGALDVSGLERLMEVLQQKAAERGTVMVISHNDLKEWISQTMTIERLPNDETRITEGIA